MTQVLFIEAGEGDPSQRYENARLGLLLSRRDEQLFSFISPMRDISNAAAPRGRLWLDHEGPAIVIGARTMQGYRLSLRDSEFDLPAFDLRCIAGARSGLHVQSIPCNGAAGFVNQLMAQGYTVGIHDAGFPDARYRVLSGPRPTSTEYLTDALRLKGNEDALVNLIAQPQDSTADRRFFFVDGELISDSPIAFGLEFWQEEIRTYGWDPDATHASSGFSYQGARPVKITQNQRSFAREIATELRMISGYVDVVSSDETPWLSGVHHSHIGDFSLYGADIRALAAASLDHIKQLVCPEEPAPLF